MVGLSDIPCVGVALNKMSEATVEAAYRGLRYMFCYKSLVIVLNSEIETFNIQESRVSQKVVEARDNGKILEDHVSKWQRDALEIQESSIDFAERYKKRASWRCIQCVPIPNPLSRFRLGREAVQKTEKMAALTESGKDLLANPIAHLPPVENRPKTDGEFLNFPSRQHAYEKIWQSLVTEGSPYILGIYGMPGAGKTRLAEQIWEEAKQKGIFDKVTRAVVRNEKLDVIKLQKDLAGHLNCSFESQDDVDRRASQLKQSLMNGGKILIILDDVWTKIPLDVIGIQFGAGTSSKGSKILLTSREENVCLSNDCIDPVKITRLTVDEAWDMFKDTVGTSKIESLQDESLAKQVCNKCAGLPLIICAVGKTLKFMSQHLWRDALKQLENCNIQSVPGIGPEVYACLKLSFDNLDKDAKLCLLLSSLYPEDTDINIRNLIMIAKGSQLVDGSRVFAMVDILKSSSLLLEDLYNNERFRLHDIIRDVARSIAVNDYAFHFAISDMQLPHNYNRTPALLCLDVNDITFYSPEDMVCDGIYTLWIETTFIRKFQVWEVASMCVNLRFLNLKNIEWEQQIHVQQLGKLRTLVLEKCNIRKTDFSFISENLETLCLWKCDLPEPLNIINLKYLRKLEIIGEPVFLVANTISCLSRLEELHLISGYRYQQYRKEVDDDEFTRIQLNDISKLTRLKSLKMCFAGASLQHIQHPKLFANLREFDIYVGEVGRESTYSCLPKKSIHILGEKLEAFQSLIERAQSVILVSTDVDVSSIFNSNTEAFADLEYLEILDSDTMKQLARILSQNHQIQPQTSFYKLTQLYISNCSAMKYLFSNSVAKCLVQLVKLSVRDCDVMETIIMNDDSTTDGKDIVINFSKLKYLKLSRLPQLKSFYLENKDIHSTSLFCGKVAFPALEQLYVKNLEDAISDIWGKQYYNDNASSFSKLKILEVQGCTKLETVIPLAMSHKLQNLQRLFIYDCSSVISEVGIYDNNTAVCPLVALTKMYLQKLPCLKNTWLNSTDHSDATNLYPNLRELHIKECHSLSVDHSQATNLYPRLKELYIQESDSSSVDN